MRGHSGTIGREGGECFNCRFNLQRATDSPTCRSFLAGEAVQVRSHLQSVSSSHLQSVRSNRRTCSIYIKPSTSCWVLYRISVLTFPEARRSFYEVVAGCVPIRKRRGSRRSVGETGRCSEGSPRWWLGRCQAPLIVSICCSAFSSCYSLASVRSTPSLVSKRILF